GDAHLDQRETGLRVRSHRCITSALVVILNLPRVTVTCTGIGLTMSVPAALKSTWPSLSRSRNLAVTGTLCPRDSPSRARGNSRACGNDSVTCRSPLRNVGAAL